MKSLQSNADERGLKGLQCGDYVEADRTGLQLEYNNNTLAQGSFTVEAACVMSVALLVILGALHLFFHMHNRSFLTVSACEAALCGSMDYGLAGRDPAMTAWARAELLGYLGTIGATNLHTDVVSRRKLTVSYRFDTIFDFIGAKWHSEVSATTNFINPVGHVRLIKSVNDVLARNEGGNTG